MHNVFDKSMNKLTKTSWPYGNTPARGKGREKIFQSSFYLKFHNMYCYRKHEWALSKALHENAICSTEGEFITRIKARRFAVKIRNYIRGGGGEYFHS